MGRLLQKDQAVNRLFVVVFTLLLSCARTEPAAAQRSASSADTVPVSATERHATCGKDRWAVKTGGDPGASAPMPVVQTTVAELNEQAAPRHIPEHARTTGTESTIYDLHDVQMGGWKHEADGDIHLVVCERLASANSPHHWIACADGPSLVVEIPDPACVPASSPWHDQIAQARRVFDGAPGEEVWVVSIRGVGFFDREHGQTGAARNGIELHPVIAICFGVRCRLPEVGR